MYNYRGDLTNTSAKTNTPADTDSSPLQLLLYLRNALWFCFQNWIRYFLNTLTKQILCFIIINKYFSGWRKLYFIITINDIRGDPNDASAKTETPVTQTRMPVSSAIRLLLYLRDAHFLDSSTKYMIAELTTFNKMIGAYGTWRLNIDRSGDGRFHSKVVVGAVLTSERWKGESIGEVIVNAAVMVVAIGHIAYLAKHWFPSFIEFMRVRPIFLPHNVCFKPFSVVPYLDITHMPWNHAHALKSRACISWKCMYILTLRKCSLTSCLDFVDINMQPTSILNLVYFQV